MTGTEVPVKQEPALSQVSVPGRGERALVAARVQGGREPRRVLVARVHRFHLIESWK